MNDNKIYKWLLLTTVLPYGGVEKGHLVVEGVGLDTTYADSYHAQITWGFVDGEL